MINGDTAAPALAQYSKAYNAMVNSESDYWKRITFKAPDRHAETLWAIKVGENQYRLQNAPIFYDDACLGDIVAVTHDEANPGILLFHHVIEEGNNVPMVMFGLLHLPEMQRGLKAMQNLGIGVEQWGGSLAVLSFPFGIDIPNVETVFGMKDPPFLMAAPPGAWVHQVVGKMYAGDRGGAFELVCQKTREFHEEMDTLSENDVNTFDATNAPTKAEEEHSSRRA
jgi:hypothetical protein